MVAGRQFGNREIRRYWLPFAVVPFRRAF